MDERVCLDCKAEGIAKPERVVSPRGSRFPRCRTHQLKRKVVKSDA